MNEDVDTNMSVEVGDDTGEKEATTAKKAAEPTDGTDYTCDNKYCKDFGKAFKYKSQKTQHERLVKIQHTRVDKHSYALKHID